MALSLLNRLQPVAARTFVYNAVGNLVQRTDRNGRVIEYADDDLYRRIEEQWLDAQQSPIRTMSFYLRSRGAINRRLRLGGRLRAHQYDAIGRRISVTHDIAGLYIHDGERWERGNAGDHLALVFDGNGDLTNRYLHGPAVDQILADEQVDCLTAPGDVLWPLTDNPGTVRDRAAYDDTTGITAIATHLTYNAFGQITAQTDPTVTRKARTYAHLAHNSLRGRMLCNR